MLIRAIWRRALRRPLPELPGRVARLLAREAREAGRRWAFRRGRFSVGMRELRRALGSHKVDEALSRVGRRPLGVTALSADERRRFAAGLRLRFPNVCAEILARADAACAHRFDLLGSGPVDLGPSIDWSRDFKTGFRWSRGFYQDLIAVDLGNDADVKVPWELSRCQHWVTLGQAYWLTGDDRYAQEFVAELRPWIAENPVMGTINWYNAMEVALRIVNWLWASALFRDASAFTAEDRARILAGALEHGRFIADNLEAFPGEPTSNHYLSDLVGLVYLGVLVPELEESRAWLETGLSRLVSEMKAQVHADGVDYECSIGYHRFATELFASAFALCRQNGIQVPDWAWKRLERMVEFIQHYTRPDGGAPVIGDADDGRVHVLTPAPPDDHRHLLGFGGALLGRPDLLSAADPASHEAAWWFGLEEAPDEADTTGPRSRAFPDGGFYLMRHGDRYLLAACCHPQGPTGHAHNDASSFELAALGRSWIVDSGTYVYTASALWRHRFRSTASHNTVMIDDAELNEIEVDRPFARGKEAIPRVLRWESTEAEDLLEVEHDGYRRLSGCGVHRRRFFFDKRGARWRIDDTIEGTGRRRVRAFLHFAPGLQVTADGPTRVVASAEDGARLGIEVSGLDRGGKLSVQEGWVSRSYGRKSPAPVVELMLEAELPVSWHWQIVPTRTGGA